MDILSASRNSHSGLLDILWQFQHDLSASNNSLFDKARYMRRKHNYQTNVLKSKIDHCNYITKLKLLLKEWSKMRILRELHIFSSFNGTEDSFIIEWEPYNSNPSLGTGLKVVGTCIFIGFESLERGTRAKPLNHRLSQVPKPLIY